jgi:hypothetical protein
MSHKQQHRGLWHFINWRFKPEGQPASIQIKDLDPEHLKAMVENESVAKNRSMQSERQFVVRC